MGTAQNGEDGVVRCRTLQPDVVILDLVLPDACGFAVWDQLNALLRPPKILLLTCRADEALFHRLVLGEAGGMIWKRVDFAQYLRPAIATLSIGCSYFPADVSEAISKFRRSPDAFYKLLSPWELKLLALLALGQKDGDIAREIKRSCGTIRNHWHNIAVKLGLRDRHDLKAWAAAKGFAPAVRSINPNRVVK